MNRQKSFENQKPTLYIVSTPIGNLSELTPRAIEILKSVDLIACEDTRVTMKLCQAFEINTPLLSHHAHNQELSVNKILDALQNGKNVALVSDAGTPLISDPGDVLVNCVLMAGFNVVPISGSSALISALVASNIVTQPFLFHGFLPSSGKNLRKVLLEYKYFSYTMIFYISVHKLTMTLREMLTVLGDRKICLAREMTKKHEEFLRGNLSEFVELNEELKGEFVCVVSGNPHEKEAAIDELIVNEKVNDYIEKGYSASAAIKAVSKDLNVSKNEIYRLYHAIGNIC